jgi:hypothetical protein
VTCFAGRKDDPPEGQPNRQAKTQGKGKCQARLAKPVLQSRDGGDQAGKNQGCQRWQPDSQEKRLLERIHGLRLNTFASNCYEDIIADSGQTVFNIEVAALQLKGRFKPDALFTLRAFPATNFFYGGSNGLSHTAQR